MFACLCAFVALSTANAMSMSVGGSQRSVPTTQPTQGHVFGPGSPTPKPTPSSAPADNTFMNGQAYSDAFTAGGTSTPCTGLYCQDNPLGNPCPCPVWRPCKHDNIPDGHCMNRVDIFGSKKDDKDCRVIFGVWSAVVAGQENTGEIPPGNCLCTAGSTDVYENVDWGNCQRENPRWCDKDGQGNACPPPPTPAYPDVNKHTPGTINKHKAAEAPCVNEGGERFGTSSTTMRMMKTKDMTKTTVRTTSSFKFTGK